MTSSNGDFRPLVDITSPKIMKEFARKCPQLNAAISKRHYLLPKVRQGDYVDQEFCDNHIRNLLLNWGLGKVQKQDSLNLEALNVIAALKYDRPILYLERELGEKLRETEVPGDFTTAEIYWPWPAFRVMLPWGLIADIDFPGYQNIIGAEARVMNAVYLDLTLWERGTKMGLAREHAKELKGILGEETSGTVEDFMDSEEQGQTGFYLSAMSDYQLPGYQPDVATCLSHWDDANLQDLIAVRKTAMKGSVPDEVNHVYLQKARSLAFNLLLFLSQEPVSIFADGWIRVPKKDGKRLVSGLLPARFVGDCMPKFRVNPPVVVKADSEPTGRTHAPHWVKGHWQRIAYGKGRQLRRRQWIMPYKTGGEIES